MYAVLIVLIVLAYLSVGGFLAGIFGVDDYSQSTILFFAVSWPIWAALFAVIFLVGIIVKYPLRFAVWLREKVLDLAETITYWWC